MESGLPTDYIRIRDAVWRWERLHGRFDRVVSGCQGYVLRGRQKLYNELPDPLLPDDVIHGADMIGQYFARVHLYPVDLYPADWTRGGKVTYDSGAGPERNQQMVDVGDGLVVVYYVDSVGTPDALRRAARKRIPIVAECLGIRLRR